MQSQLFTTPTTTHYPPSQVKLLPLRERPAYRASSTPAACTSIELLAAVIGGPQQIETANALLAKFVTLRRIFNAHVNDIEAVPGVGSQMAARIKAALAVGLRMATDDAQEQTAITSPADAANLVMYEMGLLPEEHLRVILLNTRNHVIEIVEVYKGSVNSSQIRIGEVFQAAIAQKASGIIICHNHPSSDITPSPDDVAVTRAIVQAGKLLDIQALDHLIVGSGGKWCSLKERGLGFS
ncbi:MAG: DNA repair protein RadC [Chloroflexota bacterium]